MTHSMQHQNEAEIKSGVKKSRVFMIHGFTDGQATPAGPLFKAGLNYLIKGMNRKLE